MATTSTERVRASRERKREIGLVQLEVWCLPEDVEKVKKIEARGRAALARLTTITSRAR